MQKVRVCSINTYTNFKFFNKILQQKQYLFFSFREISDEFDIPLEKIELSMGMSNDFEEAIKMGSTNIRVGSSIFGARNYPNKPSEKVETPNQQMAELQVKQYINQICHNYVFSIFLDLDYNFYGM